MINSTGLSPAWRRTARRAVAALLATMSLVAAAAAHATAPTTTVEQRDVKVTRGDCGSFTLIFEADVMRKITTFYDEHGIPVRDVLVRASEGAVFNSVTRKSVPFTGMWRVTRDYTDGEPNGTATQTGRTYVITVPELGVIFHQTGRGVQVDGRTVFEAGPHDFEHIDVDELCAYLAG